MVKGRNNKEFSFMGTISYNQPKVKSKSLKEVCHVFYPPGKPIIPHLLRCQGFAVAYPAFSGTSPLDALALPVVVGSYERHPRLLQREGLLSYFDFPVPLADDTNTTKI
jgi:hypothetical protein